MEKIKKKSDRVIIHKTWALTIYILSILALFTILIVTMLTVDVSVSGEVNCDLKSVDYDDINETLNNVEDIDCTIKGDTDIPLFMVMNANNYINEVNE